ARADALRGLGVLRQTDAGAPRGFHAAAEPGHAHFRAGAERDLARELRRAARTLLALGGGSVAACRPAGFRSGGEILRRCVPSLPLAIAGDPHADLPRNGDRARGSRQGGHALSPRPTPARALSRYLPPPV